MRLQEFRRIYKRELAFWDITERYTMFKPFEIWDKETDQTFKFKSLDDALSFKTDKGTIREIILKLKDMSGVLNGGRGARSIGTGKGYPMTSLFPAHMNTATFAQGKGKNTLRDAETAFSKRHRDSKVEFISINDDNGYSHEYNKGNKGSVGFTGRNNGGRHVIHNHPSDGKTRKRGYGLSTADVLNTVKFKDKSITAVAREGDYKLSFSNNFYQKSGNVKAFTKAYTRAEKMAYKNSKNLDVYDRTMKKWYQKNAKKYGIKYTFTPNRDYRG